MPLWNGATLFYWTFASSEVIETKFGGRRESQFKEVMDHPINIGDYWLRPACKALQSENVLHVVYFLNNCNKKPISKQKLMIIGTEVQ